MKKMELNLKNRLFFKFEDGMNFENYGRGKGKWHIDHIIPVTWFEFKNYTDKQFQLCWSLENLQPLWHSQNSSKSNYRMETNNKITKKELLELLIKYFEVVEI
jgi:hypothetical protein